MAPAQGTGAARTGGLRLPPIDGKLDTLGRAGRGYTGLSAR